MVISVIVLLIMVIIAVKRCLNLKTAKTKELESSDKYKKLQELEKELAFYRE